jgi:hypothetical protein
MYLENFDYKIRRVKNDNESLLHGVAASGRASAGDVALPHNRALIRHWFIWINLGLDSSGTVSPSHES